jgi:hypothetical protein
MFELSYVVVQRDDGLSDVSIVSQVHPIDQFTRDDEGEMDSHSNSPCHAEDLIASRLLGLSFFTRSALTYSNPGVE